MTGVTKPAAALGASAALGSSVAKGVLPFTGIALSVYLAVGLSLLLAGVVLRVLSRNRG